MSTRIKKIVTDYFEEKSEEWETRETEYVAWLSQVLLNITDKKNKTLLDVGCGTGRYMQKFTPHLQKVSGIDISSNMIKKAKEKGLDVHVGDAEHLPFPDNSFDVIISIGVLEHLGDYSKALLEMKRVAKNEVVAINLNFLCPINIATYAINKDNRRSIITHPKLLFPFSKKKVFKQCGYKEIYCKIYPGFSPQSSLGPLNEIISKIPFLRLFGGILLVGGKIRKDHS